MLKLIISVSNHGNKQIEQHQNNESSINNFNNSVNQLPWRPKHIYHYIQWLDIQPDLLIDITDFQEKKMNAIKAYSSQFYNPKSEEPVTPISSKNFLDSIKQRDNNFGRISGVNAAEGFTVEIPLLIKKFETFI